MSDRGQALGATVESGAETLAGAGINPLLALHRGGGPALTVKEGRVYTGSPATGEMVSGVIVGRSAQIVG